MAGIPVRTSTTEKKEEEVVRNACSELPVPVGMPSKKSLLARKEYRYWGRPTCQGRRFVATCDSTPICRNGQSTNLSEIVEQNTEASQDSRPTSGGVCVVRLVRILRIRRSSQARTKRSGQAGIHPRAATGAGRACC